MRNILWMDMFYIASAQTDTTTLNKYAWALVLTEEQMALGVQPYDTMFSPDFWTEGPQVMQSGIGTIWSACRAAAQLCAIAPNVPDRVRNDMNRACRVETGYGLWLIVENCIGSPENLQLFGMNRALIRS